MLSFLKRSLLLSSILLFYGLPSLAQGGITTSVSTASQFCPMPSTLVLNYYQPNLYPVCSATDTFLLRMYWDDGTDTSFYRVTNFPYCYFSGTLSHVYSIPGNFSPMLVVSYPDSTLDTAYIGITISPGCITLDGMAYIDENENCSFEGPDILSYNLPITFTDTNGVSYLGFCDSSGHFEVSIPEGIGPVQHDPSTGNLLRTCPDTGNLLYSSNTDSTFNLGFECDSDSMNQVLTMHGPRIGAPGELGGIDMTIYNSSCGNLVKQIELRWDTLLTYEDCLDCTILPDSIVGNSAFWSPELGTFSGQSSIEDNQFFTGRLRFRTDTGASMNQPTTMRGSIEYTNDEIDSIDNIKVRTRYVGVPIDPNNKIVDPQGVGPLGRVVPHTQLTYTVNFQNTGNAPARHVKILDSLPEFLDPSTIQILGSRHYMKTSFYQGGVLRFDFPDINLPDSTSNEPESHGWLVFSIEPKEVPLGTEIQNRVGIYFDYQAPVITNYTLTTIDTFPNSVDGYITSIPMTCNTTPNGSATVYPTDGNGQYTFIWNTGDTTATIQNLKATTYTVTITDRVDSIHVVSTTIDHNPTHPDPTIGSFDGPSVVQAWRPNFHSVENVLDNTYAWDVRIGEVLQSLGNSVEVLWHAGPNGTLIVTQTNEYGCSVTDSAEVPILFVGQEELNSQGALVFPNPTRDKLYFQGLPAENAIQATITDIQGRTVMKAQINAEKSWIKVLHLSNGNYTIHLTSENEKIGTCSFVKE